MTHRGGAERLPWARWLPNQRWYGGRDRTLASGGPLRVVPLRADLDLVIVDVAYTDGSAERYQVVAQWRSEPSPGRTPIGEAAGRTAYDALQLPEPARFLLSLAGIAAPEDAEARVVDSEQTNTSVVVGERVILKAFRHADCGANPDVELNRVLTAAGNPHTATLLGSIETPLDGRSCPLAMVSEYAPDATDGWKLAVAGGFEGQAHALGAAVASVHATLAGELGTATAVLSTDAMRSRLESAAARVPQLARYRAAVEERYAALAGQPIAVQRIHGDLHLGQALRTPRTWLLIDFEGEPGAPSAQRRQRDSPLRDIAGMLRSFDYAARQGGHPRRWVERNRTQFCEGYAAESGSDPREDPGVLACYELDKAVYEAAYEARYRPDWLPIPLAGIGRLLG